ncbi:nitrogen fixation protein NifZ [Neiella marina]|uniref:Nitrogen fixation protein NifZ n=1 Tax=Neiella holothuriorum TaxID=2870530 RepID=A0ABS7EJQ7_9GAMM|nr:nitrogen fixation protein NifZ [Neiella holothuriorum]MBW8192579.1 nitrogen fixation protein NifZ [Neiella holothuriorum]
MIDAKYEYGTKVRLISNVRNDGSFPGKMKGDLLLRRGSEGYVQQAGMHLQENVIYQVHFIDQNVIVGCKETELMDAALPWIDNEFEYGDRAQLTINLASQGVILAKLGQVVSVISVDRDDPESIQYRIQHGELDVMVPARALCAVKDDALPEVEMLNDHVA